MSSTSASSSSFWAKCVQAYNCRCRRLTITIYYYTCTPPNTSFYREFSIPFGTLLTRKRCAVLQTSYWYSNSNTSLLNIYHRLSHYTHTPLYYAHAEYWESRERVTNKYININIFGGKMHNGRVCRGAWCQHSFYFLFFCEEGWNPPRLSSFSRNDFRCWWGGEANALQTMPIGINYGNWKAAMADPLTLSLNSCAHKYVVILCIIRCITRSSIHYKFSIKLRLILKSVNVECHLTAS